MSLDTDHAIGPEQSVDAVGHGFDHGSAALLHCTQVEVQRTKFDAVRRELIFCALEQLRGLQQCLGRTTAGIEAGAAKGVAAIGVLPLTHAGPLQFVLPGPDRGRITRGSRADDNHIVSVTHICSTMRAGSSRHCFTVTKNCTASRPSIMRWS